MLPWQTSLSGCFNLEMLQFGFTRSSSRARSCVQILCYLASIVLLNNFPYLPCSLFAASIPGGYTHCACSYWVWRRTALPGAILFAKFATFTCFKTGLDEWLEICFSFLRRCLMALTCVAKRRSFTRPGYMLHLCVSLLLNKYFLCHNKYFLCHSCWLQIWSPWLAAGAFGPPIAGHLESMRQFSLCSDPEPLHGT